MFLLYPSFISDPSFEKSTTKTANYFPFITLSQIPQKQQRITQNQNYQKVFSLFTVNQIYEGENQYSCPLHVHIFAFLLIMTYVFILECSGKNLSRKVGIWRSWRTVRPVERFDLHVTILQVKSVRQIVIFDLNRQITYQFIIFSCFISPHK